jgi:hypothetical protein
MPDPQVHPMVQNAVDSVAAQFGRFVAKPDVLKTNWVKGHRKFIEKWYPDDRIHKAAPGPDRANFRSATPLGFAKAVFACNG